MAINFTPKSNIQFQGPAVSQPSLAERIWGGLSGVVSSVEQPFVSLAAKPVQLLAKATGQQDPFAQGIPAGLPGAGTTAKVSPPSLSGTTGDLLKAGGTIAAVASPATTIPRAIATGAGIGASTFGGSALQEEKPAVEVIKQAGIGAAVGGVTAGALAGLGKLVAAVGGKIQKSVIKPTKPDIADGFKMETIKKYNLGGSLNTIRDKTQNKLNQVTNELNGKLASSNQRLNLDDVFNQTVKELTDSSKLKGFGANTKILNGLNQLKQEISIVNQTGGVSIPEAQIIKQASGGFGAWQYGKVDPDSKATEIIYNTFYNKLKTAIEQSSPQGVQALNKQLSELIPVMNAIIRRIPVAERSNLISLNEMIGIVGSAVNPIALGPTILSLISRSGAAGNVFTKIGPAITGTAAPASFITSKTGEQVLNSQR